jgi:hypothetical protein
VTNRLASLLALLLLAAILLDVWLYGSEHLVFLGKKFLELIEWMAFWR